MPLLALALGAVLAGAAGAVNWPPFPRGKEQGHGVDRELLSVEAWLEGDQRAFLGIFGAKRPELLATGFQWTEGPLFRPPHWVFFSDTIDAKLWRFRPAPNWQLQLVLDDSGGGRRIRCDDKLAEPGSNGLAEHPLEPNVILMCQHCARRVVALDLDTHRMRTIADHGPGGKRLNSPNDVAVHPSGTHVYFTDPIYGFLEKERFDDLPYLDEQGELGFQGIYRVPLSGGEAELLDASLSRPNGIAFSADGRRLFVSECCQGEHNASCAQGMHRFVRFDLSEDGPPLRGRKEVLIDLRGERSAEAGCADGFAVHEPTGLLISACAGGICLVDVEEGRLVSRLVLGYRMSNVAFGRDGYVYLTGQQALWRLPLREDRSEL